jgi:hypothetical protein
MEFIMKKLVLSFLFLTGYQLQAAESHAAQVDGQVVISFPEEKDPKGRIVREEAFYSLAALNQFGYFEGALEFHKQRSKNPITCPVFKDVFDNLTELIACQTQEAYNAKLAEYALSDLVQLYLAAHFLQLKDFNQNEIQFNRLSLMFQKLFALLETASLDNHDSFMLIDNNPALKKSLIKKIAWSLKRTLQGHTRSVDSATFSPNGLLLATASDDGTVRLWDTRTDACVCILQGHTGSVISFEFSLDGLLLATASDDGTVRIWNPQTGRCLHTLQGHTGSVISVKFNRPDRSLLATASWDRTVRIWNPQSGACLHTLQGHTGLVCLAAFSLDGLLLVTVSWDRTARIWDAQSGACLHTLQGHTGLVCSAAFSDDGRLIVTASWDRTARIWDAQTGVCVHTLQGHTGLVCSAAFFPSGQSIATASDDGTVRLWHNNFSKAGLTLEQALERPIQDVICVARTGKTLTEFKRDQTRKTQLKIVAGTVVITAALAAIAYKLWNWSK